MKILSIFVAFLEKTKFIWSACLSSAQIPLLDKFLFIHTVSNLEQNMYVRKYLVLKVTKVQMQRDKDFVCIVSQARSKIFTVFHYGTQWIRLAVMWEENFSPDNVFSSALWQYGLSNF